MTTVFKDTVSFDSHADSRGQGRVFKTFFATTTSATPLVVYAHPCPLKSGLVISSYVVGLKSDGTEMIRASVESGFRRAGSGNVAEVGADSVFGTAEDSAGTPTVTLVANTTNQTADVTLTGEASKTIYWEVSVEYQQITVL